MAVSPTVQVEGVAELGRALGRIDKELRKDLNRELRSIGNNVRDAARAEAEKRRKTGREVRGIKTSVRKFSVTIRSSAKDTRGRSYPLILEFDGSSEPTDDAILVPTARRMMPATERAIESMLDNVLRGF